MQTVIQKLSEIETAAIRIMDDAAAKKKQMDQKFRDDCDAFDQKLDGETEQKLAAVRDSLNSAAERELKGINEQVLRSLGELDREYEQRHEEWAEQIFDHLIRK